jgi:hypothetical protein
MVDLEFKGLLDYCSPPTKLPHHIYSCLISGFSTGGGSHHCSSMDLLGRASNHQASGQLLHIGGQHLELLNGKHMQGGP